MGRRRKQEEAAAKLLALGVKRGREQGFMRALESAAAYVLGREVDDVLQALSESPENALRIIAIAARDVWPNRWREALAGPLSAVMEAATDSAAPVLGSFTLQNPMMREYLDGYTSKLAGTLSGTSYGEFERVLRQAQDDGLSVPDTAKLLRRKLPELNAGRAKTIARTELNTASNGASHEQALRSGVVKTKTHRTARDSRVRPDCRVLEGETVPIDQPFSNGAMYPSKPNDRCTLEFGIDWEALRGRAS